MPSGRRGARGVRRPPETGRELLAYCAGRRHRRRLVLPIGQTVPTLEQVHDNLHPDERRLALTVSPARWWACYWRGWRDGAGGAS